MIEARERKGSRKINPHCVELKEVGRRHGKTEKKGIFHKSSNLPGRGIKLFSKPGEEWGRE